MNENLVKRLLENKSAELNLSLAKRVEEEVDKNREKELLVFQKWLPWVKYRPPMEATTFCYLFYC